MEKFWADQDDWPPDYGGKLFLGRAILKVGAVLFPGDWQDKDAAALESNPIDLREPKYRYPKRRKGNSAGTRQISNSPSHSSDSGIFIGYGVDEYRARKLLSEFGDLVDEPSPSDSTQALTEEQIQAAQEIARRLTELNAARKQRRSEVIDWLIAQAAEGKLTTFLQPMNGGAYSEPILPGRWRAPRKLLAPRFSKCEMDHSEAFPGRRRRRDNGYIIVDGDELDALLSKSDGKPKKRRQTRSYSETEIEEWLLTLVAKIKSRRHAHCNTTEAEKLAVKAMPGLSTGEFRKVRVRVWPWKSGPRPKSDTKKTG